jgi:hypothetical protein
LKPAPNPHPKVARLGWDLVDEQKPFFFRLRHQRSPISIAKKIQQLFHLSIANVTNFLSRGKLRAIKNSEYRIQKSGEDDVSSIIRPNYFFWILAPGFLRPSVGLLK